MNKLVIFAALVSTTVAYSRYRPTYRSLPYKFEYDVNHGDNQFGHQQQNDGRVTSGSYRVALPDGRTQIVTYRADHNGYNADVTYEESEYNPIRLNYHHPAPQTYYPPAQQAYYPPAPSTYYPPAPPKPHFLRPSSYESTAPLPIKPLAFRTPSYGSAAKPFTSRTTPFYTSPAVPPFGAPAIQDYNESFEAASAPILFRDNVAYRITPHAEYRDRMADEFRSAFGKRSAAIDLWNETSILEVLPSAAEVEAELRVIEDVVDEANDYETSVTPAPVELVEVVTDDAIAAKPVRSYTPEDYSNDGLDYANPTEVEPLPAPETIDVEVPVEVGTDSASETYDFGSDVIDFDDLPFPLPLPLAFRPYAV